ncbi:MAG: hypothetical protein ACLFTP_10075 [Rhodosalinus sp.]
MSEMESQRAQIQPIVPSGGAVLRAGLSGAAIAGVWTGIYETIRVRNGEIGSEEAVRTTLNSAAIGAGAGTVATIVGHVARSMPLLALAGAAIGLIYLANQSHRVPSATPEDDAAPGSDEDDPDDAVRT